MTGVTEMKTVEVGDLSFAVADRGEGPAVVLLHGFPDSHAVWRHQIKDLANARYRVIAPDLRGFGNSSKPQEAERYGMLDIAGDVLAIMDSLGVERAHVVGHDWGAALSWAMAAFVPDRVDHLVAMSVGHLSSFASLGFEQREKSWYMLLFQFEDIAEQWLSADDFANMRAWARHPDIDDVVAQMSRPGALTAALNWYRANVHPRTLIEPPIEFPPISAPTMGMWSTGDFALVEAGMTGSERYVSGPWRYERLDGPGHWMQLEQPDRVSSLLLDFLPTR